MRARPDRAPMPSNAAMRRSDWRFLIGAATLGRVVAHADEDLRQAVTAWSDEIVDLALAGDGHDVAVLSSPTADQLRRAVHALTPGGRCYVEWRSPVPWSRRRHRLEAAGFVDVETYLLWPPPHRAPVRFWIPTSAPHAGSHLLSQRLLSQRNGATVTARAATNLLRVLWKCVSALRLVAPTCAVARRPTTEPRELLLRDDLRERWGAWGLGPLPATWSLTMIAGGESHLNKLVVLIFHGDRTPQVAVKVARVDEAERGLEREAAALHSLVGYQPRRLFEVPRLLAADRFAGGFLAVAETAVVGTPLTGSITAATYAPIAERLATILIDLVGTPAPPHPAWHDRLEAIVAPFAQAFECHIASTHIASARRSLATVAPLPTAFEHRDCSPWNVLATPENGLAFLDWESATERGVPLLDLVYFLANAAFVATGTLNSGREPETYAGLLDGSSPMADAFHTSIESYCEQIGVPETSVAPLRILTWMLHAPGEIRRRIDVGEDHATAVDRSVFLALWRAELERTDTDSPGAT